MNKAILFVDFTEGLRLIRMDRNKTWIIMEDADSRP